MTDAKPHLTPESAGTAAPSDRQQDLITEIDVLLHLLPGSALHLKPPGEPDEEAVEAGFDNMPV